jgi:hypothetical protein
LMMFYISQNAFCYVCYVWHSCWNHWSSCTDCLDMIQVPRIVLNHTQTSLPVQCCGNENDALMWLCLATVAVFLLYLATMLVWNLMGVYVSHLNSLASVSCWLTTWAFFTGHYCRVLWVSTLCKKRGRQISAMG